MAKTLTFFNNSLNINFIKNSHGRYPRYFSKTQQTIKLSTSLHHLGGGGAFSKFWLFQNLKHLPQYWLFDTITTNFQPLLITFRGWGAFSKFWLKKTLTFLITSLDIYSIKKFHIWYQHYFSKPLQTIKFSITLHHPGGGVHFQNDDFFQKLQHLLNIHFINKFPLGHLPYFFKKIQNNNFSTPLDHPREGSRGV